MASSLPIDEVRGQLLEAVTAHPAVVLEAPPGAGKTTRVPPLLLDVVGPGQDVLVLEPRRLAARLSAQRVAQERGEKLGDTVGYQVRFEEVASARTRVRYLTEGLLLRRFLSDPTLARTGAVVLDEFHERNLASDLSLALCRALQRGPRPDLKLVVMSATLDAEPLAAWLDAPRVRSEGRRFEVRVEYLPRPDERRLEDQVLGALKRLVQDGLDGHVLVFLPGAGEIRRCLAACAELASRHGLTLLPLHGELSAEEQNRAVAPTEKGRRVLFATNVAETSITIEGVSAVVDSGLHRAASHSPWTNLPELKLTRISRSSAIQRQGRAGRTREGLCLRLYTREDFEGRPAADAPEIRRADLGEPLLLLKALGVADVRGFNFFEAPAPAALDAAVSLLRGLGALDADEALTPTGRRMLELPVHPRLGRVLVEAERRGVSHEGATLAALLSERDVRLSVRGLERQAAQVSGPSDALELLERFEVGLATGARGAGLDERGVQAVERLRTSLSRLLKRGGPRPQTTPQLEEALLQCLLAGFGDRLARRRRPRSDEVVFAAGGSGRLDETSTVKEAELLVALEAEERRGGVVVLKASEVQPEWLLAGGAFEVQETDALAFNAAAGRVERVTRLGYGAIALEETRAPASPSPQAGAVLAAAVKLEQVVEPEGLARFTARLEAARLGFPEAGFPADVEALLRRTVEALASEVNSVEALRELGVLRAAEGSLTPAQTALLRAHLPESLTLPGGRTVKVHYEAGKPPWIESRLQDFFGLTEGPRIGKSPLVLHLLAPNQRAVQVTTDLSGFWDRHYPALRRELMRRYPRHAWPEDPRTAAPPAPRRR